jgi:hypothetical protein
MMPSADLPVEAIRRAAGNPEFRAALSAFYARLDQRVAAQQPVCTNRGACCRFGEYDHHLFVTAVELAYFLAQTPAPLWAPPDRSFCPYQQAGQCTARDPRPTGCRIFFCDPQAQHWQAGMTEEALRELANLGERFGIPYVYLEWTDALRALGGEIVSRPTPVKVTLLRPDGQPDRPMWDRLRD